MKGIVTALALTMALLLTGCGSRSQVPDRTPDNRPDAPVTDQAGNQTVGEGNRADGSYDAEPDGTVTDRPDGDRNGSLSQDAQDVVDDTADAAQDVTDGVLNGARDAVDGVVDGARDVTNDVIDGVDDMAGAANRGVRDATRESRTAR